MRCQTDPLTRLIHITYGVPADAPDRLVVRCAWSPRGQGRWQPARVEPLISETAEALTPSDDAAAWRRGEVVEWRAAGLERTLVFNPYPEALAGGVVDIDVRIALHGAGDEALACLEAAVWSDHRDVVYLDDWRAVLQPDAVEAEARPGCWRLEAAPAPGEVAVVAGGRRLAGDAGTALPQLTMPMALRGPHALFVCASGGVRLRLSGDLRCDRLASLRPGQEEFWRWSRLDGQHLVVRQSYDYTGPAASAIEYVKAVPLTADLVAHLEGAFGAPDRFVASYWEPYSYAFADDVQDMSWHLQYLDAYREANVSLVDTQLGRFGMKMVFESRVADQLLYQTQGDPIGAVAQPRTTNVGRMQQYTNTLQATLTFSGMLGLTAHANFGATNCYPGSPLQGEISKQHPEWRRGGALRYEVPEVRQFILDVYREALDGGATGLSIDFCRYPEGVDTAETATGFLRELRALADEYGRRLGRRIAVLVRFPLTGERLGERFDYAVWASEGLVDYLCPSSIQGRFHYADMAPYAEAVAGTACVLLPQLDALAWGLPRPGPFLWRIRQLYDQGIQGVYVYQGDAMVLGRPMLRRCMRRLRSSAAIRQFWEEDERLRPRRSKGICLSRPSRLEGYHAWERLHLWPEGVPLGEMEVDLDGERIARFDGPPYLVGSQDHSGDTALPPGAHALRVRVRDGDGWLERTFAITVAPR